ncbi:MAG: alkaline phosphatase D family protein [Bacteroidota bacterium]
MNRIKHLKSRNSRNLWFIFFFLISSLYTSYTLAQSWLNTATRLDIDPVYTPFYHGVASGDPLSDRVIIWTRVTPDTITTGDIDVNWGIALDTNFIQVINSGIVYTNDAVDYTVKVDATGLQPNTWYYYKFNALGKNSLIGRTKTAPTGDVDSIRFAVVSGSHFEHGYYNAYERITNRNDIDAVLHLGDYIYEYAAGGGYTNDTVRIHDPEHEILTLGDYRIRYSQYRLDPQLRGLHQQYPWIIVWDDHETANNSWTSGAENHDSTSEGSWADRKAAGVQAFFEWIPIRKPSPSDNHIYREFSFGDLFDLIMLDTRLEGRDEQLAMCSDLDDTARKMLGDQQFNWMTNQLTGSTAQWKIIGQQVMIAPLEANLCFPFITKSAVNTDQWDGYPVVRDKLFNCIMDSNITDVVILTGDIHTSWANDLPLDPGTYDPGTGAGSVAVEFVTTSVTSAALPLDLSLIGVPTIKLINPHIKYINLDDKGYNIVDINKSRTQSDWYFVTTVDTLLFEEHYEESWYVNDTERFLNGTSTPSERPGPLQPQAPLLPKNTNAPLAINDIATTDSSVTVVIDVQNNDSDPDGDPLVTTIISGPNNGTANVLNGDSIEYTPNAGFTGTDTIVYIVCDNGIPPLCDTATVIIAVNSTVGIEEAVVYNNNIVLFGIYPNPFNDNILLQYYVYQPTEVHLQLTDISGKVVLAENFGKINRGLHVTGIDCNEFAAGTYILTLESGNKVCKRKVVKY